MAGASEAVTVSRTGRPRLGLRRAAGSSLLTACSCCPKVCASRATAAGLKGDDAINCTST